jgi:uncharacterized Zn-finger protein
MQCLQNKTKNMNFSRRLFKILTEQQQEEGSADQDALQTEPESDEELPIECCFCAELFYDENAKHNCQGSKIPPKPFLCEFEGCDKSFKKATELKKHQVSV